jgi:DNA-binding NarL/FixJ family response regulator
MQRSDKLAQSKARVLVVDDHPVVRHGLIQLIDSENDLEVCGQAASAQEALEVMSNSNPDLVIIDISLEGTNGIELIKQIKGQYEGMKMLVSSMHDESLYAERALRAGAMGYINKDTATEKVVTAVRQILRGKIYLSDEMSDRMLHGLSQRDGDAEQSPIQRLSNRELEVFELIGRGVTTREIAERLNLSIKTVETHRENIKRKLNLEKSSELTRCAVQWVLEETG